MQPTFSGLQGWNLSTPYFGLLASFIALLRCSTDAAVGQRMSPTMRRADCANLRREIRLDFRPVLLSAGTALAVPQACSTRSCRKRGAQRLSRDVRRLSVAPKLCWSCWRLPTVRERILLASWPSNPAAPSLTARDFLSPLAQPLLPVLRVRPVLPLPLEKGISNWCSVGETPDF